MSGGRFFTTSLENPTSITGTSSTISTLGWGSLPGNRTAHATSINARPSLTQLPRPDHLTASAGKCASLAGHGDDGSASLTVIASRYARSDQRCGRPPVADNLLAQQRLTRDQTPVM
jgi:hypothetical protein